MDKTEVKPIWGLAWGLFWRIFLITLGIYAVLGLIMLLVAGSFFIPFLGGL